MNPGENAKQRREERLREKKKVWRKGKDREEETILKRVMMKIGGRRKAMEQERWGEIRGERKKSDSAKNKSNKAGLLWGRKVHHVGRDLVQYWLLSIYSLLALLMPLFYTHANVLI